MTVRGYHVLLVLAVACLAVGSGALPVASIDRSATFAVTDDTEAYVGVQASGATASVADVQSSNDTGVGGNDTDANGSGTVASTAGSDDSGRESTASGQAEGDTATSNATSTTEATLLTVRNQFDVPVSITVTGVRHPAGGPVVTDVTGVDLAPGEVGEIAGTVTCGVEASETTLDLDLFVSGRGISAEMTRTVTVTCAE